MAFISYLYGYHCRLYFAPLANWHYGALWYVAAVATQSITMVQALGGYAEANVWLIVAAVFFSRGIINSGLGKRIAYTLIRSFGTSSFKASLCTSLYGFNYFSSDAI